MKKVLCIMLALVMVFSLASCGSTAEEEGVSNTSEQETSDSTQGTTEAEMMPESEEDVDDPAWEQLEALGNVKTENGILMVSITVPADLVGDEVTQPSLDASAGDTYTSAILNDDGSVTYKMTKAQHKAMLKSLSETIDSGLQDMVTDDTYSFTEIKHNDDYTVFDATISGTELSITDSFSTLAFYMYGGLFGIFSGNQADKVIVNFYDSTGNLIQTADSSNAE